MCMNNLLLSRNQIMALCFHNSLDTMRYSSEVPSLYPLSMTCRLIACFPQIFAFRIMSFKNNYLYLNFTC